MRRGCQSGRAAAGASETAALVRPKPDTTASCFRTVATLLPRCETSAAQEPLLAVDNVLPGADGGIARVDGSGNCRLRASFSFRLSRKWYWLCQIPHVRRKRPVIPHQIRIMCYFKLKRRRYGFLSRHWISSRVLGTVNAIQLYNVSHIFVLLN